MAMALHVAADDSAVENIESREQGGGAVAFVVVRHGAEPALLQGKARLGAVESLDLALLVDRQHDGMRRRIDIEPDHVAQFGDELRVGGELELPIAVRLQPVRLPDAPHRAGADAARLRHQVGSPVGGLGRRLRLRQRHHAFGHLPAERRDARGAGLVTEKAVDALLHETLLPAPDTGLGCSGLPHDCVGSDAVGAQQHDGRAPDMLLRCIAVPGDRFKPTAVRAGDRDGNSGAHAPDSHANRSKGIPTRTLLLGRDH